MVRKLVFVVAALAALLVPAVAGAAQTSGMTQQRGVVVKINAKAHLVAVAQTRGAVSLVHVTTVSGLKPGRIIAFSARHLRNGTFAATKVQVVGRASSFHVRGFVLAVRKSKRTVALSARGAVLSIRLPKRARSNASARGGGSPAPGSITDATVAVGADGSLSATQVKEVNPSGSAGEIAGKVTAVGAGSITVADGGVSVSMTVPSGIDVSQYSVGSEVLAYFTPEANGSFTLKAVGANGDETEANDASEIEGDVAAAEQEVEAEDEAGDGAGSSSGGGDSGSAGAGDSSGG